MILSDALILPVSPYRHTSTT